MNDILKIYDITIVRHDDGVEIVNGANMKTAPELDQHRIWHAIEDFILNDETTNDEEKNIAVHNLICNRAEILGIIPNPMEFLMGMLGGMGD